MKASGFLEERRVEIQRTVADLNFGIALPKSVTQRARNTFPLVALTTEPPVPRGASFYSSTSILNIYQ
jgi:hypothetical protein